MKSAMKQQKKKQFYTGLHTFLYSGTKTQPGYAGRKAGSKLARKAARGRVGVHPVGVVSKAFEQMQKDRRAA